MQLFSENCARLLALWSVEVAVLFGDLALHGAKSVKGAKSAKEGDPGASQRAGVLDAVENATWTGRWVAFTGR